MIKQIGRVAALVLASCFAVSALAASDGECRQSLQVFRDLGDTASFIDQSYGVAVFPTIGEGGIGIGGAYGEGCVYRGGKSTGSVDMAQISIGLQLGGQAFSQLIVFRTKEAYDLFTSGSFAFGADATAVALTYGAQAGASTSGASASAGQQKGVATWIQDMAVFTLAKGGLMYQAAIGGQKFSFTAN
jgi:lipid-binding SYLF domain-containing protein